jgi:hypothetical protein
MMVNMEERRRLLFAHTANENHTPRRRIVTVGILMVLRFFGWLGGFLYILHLIVT